MFFKKLYFNITKNYLGYNTLQLKFSAEYTDSSSSLSFSGLIKIKRDSIIWVSICPALGIEAFRFVLTNDSVKYLNRISDEYYLGNYDFISGSFDIDINYKMLQAILSDELFTYPDFEDIEDPKQSFNVKTDSIYYVLNSHKKRKIKRHIKKGRTEDFITQTLCITSEIFKLSKVYIREYESNRILNIDYFDFVNVVDKVFPEKLILSAVNLQEEKKLDLEFSNITMNEELKFTFKIPKKFQKVEYSNF
ncbi:MAG: DUF4292 domain-containing protein [Bacteroidia bacterium]|nr:DUF4292 domain-containing protein [Bacteroidia bacterium]